MNIKRFHAATSREALAKARMAFGEGTLILSNRPTANGVEVVATAEDALGSIDQAHEGFQAERRLDVAHTPTPSRKPLQERAALEVRNPVKEDTEQMAMSTLSFQDYVRERMLRRRHEALQDNRPLDAAMLERGPEPARERPAPAQVVRHNPLRPVQPMPEAPMRNPVRREHAAPSLAAPAVDPQGLTHELQSMKELIEDRFNTLSWLGQARQNPIHSNLMLKMIRAGYSPSLARAILERMPEDMDAAESVRWLMDVLERNLRTDAGGRPLYEEGGIFALVGSTGVGKTTTTAKLAAMCARVHGPGSVGLITLDTYRVGAHEQLRTYGRMLVLNAGCHGDTLDDVLTAFKTDGSQQAILSKVDEAVKLGPAIDALIRHQMVLRGVTNGQRVPEDWEAADAHKLVGASMRSPVRSAFDPKASDLNFFFSHAPDHVREKGMIDA